MASYADAVKENLEADIVTGPQQKASTQDNSYSENYEATTTTTTYTRDVDNKDIENLVVDHDENEKRTRGNKDDKKSKGVVALTVAVDIALAGLLIGTVYKKPSINKVKLGFGTVGLSLFYGFQWVFYNKYSE